MPHNVPDPWHGPFPQYLECMHFMNSQMDELFAQIHFDLLAADGKGSTGSNETQGSKDSKQSKESKKPKESKDAEERKGSKAVQESKGSKGSKDDSKHSAK
jgi:hypothetical protein